MSGVAAKAQRRDIRRAFGNDALDSYVGLMRRVTALERVLFRPGLRGFVGRLTWLVFGR